jgi:hypothetical protein
MVSSLLTWGRPAVARLSWTRKGNIEIRNPKEIRINRKPEITSIALPDLYSNLPFIS